MFTNWKNDYYKNDYFTKNQFKIYIFNAIIIKIPISSLEEKNNLKIPM